MTNKRKIWKLGKNVGITNKTWKKKCHCDNYNKPSVL